MKKVSVHRICEMALGAMFLVSAFAKAWDADLFGRMLLQYGPKWFGIWAPVIIFSEVILGMCLLLRIRPRWAAVAADIFLVTVSAVFAYGVLFRGVHDCGCFGAIDRLYEPKPWMTFVRNGVFVVLTVPVLLSNQEPVRNLPRKLIAMIVVASVACFICGLAMKRSFRLPRLRNEERPNLTVMMEKMQGVYPFSADSTYAVYLFSFTCPHCQNSFANVQQYYQLALVDKVLGIAVEDEEAQARFERIYKPEIDILTIPHDSMSHITHGLPVLVFVHANSILDMQEGLIPSPGIFLE